MMESPVQCECYAHAAPDFFAKTASLDSRRLIGLYSDFAS